MVYPHVQDEFDEAMSDPVRGFHGQVSIEAYRIAWPKGDFRAHAVYDPNTHKGGDWQQTVMINIIVTPLDPTRKLIAREIPQFAREFVGVIRPSIEALAAKIAAIKGQDVKAINPLREINKLWVAGEFVPRPDNKAGETWTTIKFVDVWATREECEAHANQSTDAENGDAATEPAPNPDAQRATLAAFLPAMWAQAGKDKAKMEELIKANSLLAGFTIDSPEVQAVMA
jgi:hypothetical protein